MKADAPTAMDAPTLKRFKDGVIAYLLGANEGEIHRDHADLRQIQEAVTFKDVQRVLSKWA